MCIELNAKTNIGGRVTIRLFNKLAITKQPSLQYNSAEEQKLTWENNAIKLRVEFLVTLNFG